MVTFNGEIYNYIELRDELKASGIIFNTESDTEVLLRAYEKWGVACQERFNGMWAFAIWDARKKELFLSRDRMGEKPLYYCEFDNSFIFGSEAKSIHKYGVPAEPDIEMLELYLTLGYVPAPYSFNKNLKKLRSGHYLVVREGKVRESSYWKLPQIPESDMLIDDQQVCSDFESLLRDSVRIRMRSDVPFGAFLSGGLDSSCVVALMSDESNHPIETFTIGYEEEDYDERYLANLVAQRYETNHHEFIVGKGVFEDSLKHILDHYDEPFGDSSAIPTGLISKEASRYVKMVLTGDGGDEALSGYTSYQGEKFSSMYNKLPGIMQTGIPGVMGAIASFTSGSLRYRMNRLGNVTSSSALPFKDRLINKLAWVSPGMIKDLVGDIRHTYRIEDYVGDVLNCCEFKDPFYQLMFFHFDVTLPEGMLTKVDRMSMAYSLETRLPFLDYRIVELMAKTDKNIKMRGYERKTVLRSTLGKKLPAEILSAPKKGFAVPLREWFKGNAFSKRLSSLSESNLGLQEAAISQIVRDNREGKYDYGNFIWMLMLLDEWQKKLA